MITSVCNIFLNSDLKFEHFKRNFSSVYSTSDNWLIYFRGKHANNAKEFIKRNFSDWKSNCKFFDNLDEENWANSTRKMLDFSRYDFIYVFLEDHFLMKPINFFKSVISDAIRQNLDYFQYSFFNIGFSNLNIELVNPSISSRFYSFELENFMIKQLKRTNPAFYPFSLASISSKKYFLRLLQTENAKLVYVPYLLQVIMENILFIYPRNRNFWHKINLALRIIRLRFVIYPPKTPFNLEKSLFDCDRHLLPVKVGILREELFANWDDDNKLSNLSLIKRGLYPDHLFLDDPRDLVPGNCQTHSVVKGQEVQSRYCPDVQRVVSPPLKFIKVIRGSLKISGIKESKVLRASESIWIYANISHSVKAILDSDYLTYLNYNDINV